MHQKLAPEPLLILLNNPKQPKIRYFERGLSKAFEKLTIFFLSSPVPFNGQSYQNQKGFGTSYQLLFRSQNNFRKIPLFVVYYLPKFDDVM